MDLPEGKLFVAAQPNGRSVTTNLIVNLQQLPPPAPWEYSFDVAIDGKQEVSLPLFVNRIESSFTKAA